MSPASLLIHLGQRAVGGSRPASDRAPEKRGRPAMTDHDGFAKAVERVGTALAAMGSGNPEPYIGCWADTEDATLFGALAPMAMGHERLAETFRWVGSR